MKKDKLWLKQEISEIFWRAEIDDNLNIQGANLIFDKIDDAIDQLDEPEVLSQEWIDDHKVARIDNLRKMTTSDVVTVENLINLLVPKQEVTEEQVMHWLDNNEFYDHATAETVLANAVDRGELGYYGTKYSVVEKTVIPQFVADWIDAHNLYGNNPLREYRDLEIDFNGGWTDEEDAAVYHWINKNPYAFIDALRYGYEVEKELYYYVAFEGEFNLLYVTHVDIYGEDGKFNYSSVFDKKHALKFTDKSKAEYLADFLGANVVEE